jgi:hypothetical protein
LAPFSGIDIVGITVHVFTPCTVVQMSTFFSRAKTALIFGLVILFGSIFPFVAVNTTATSTSRKVSHPILTEIVPVCTPILSWIVDLG